MRGNSRERGLRLKPITKIGMLKYRASYQAEVIKSARARIASAEQEVSAAKRVVREINQEISYEQENKNG